MAKRKSNDESPALPRKKAKLQQAPPNVLDAQATCLPSSASIPPESPPSQREKRKRTRSPSPGPSAKRARTQSPLPPSEPETNAVRAGTRSPSFWSRPSSVEYESDDGFAGHTKECVERLWAIANGNDPTYLPPSDVEDEIEAEGRQTHAEPEQSAMRAGTQSPSIWSRPSSVEYDSDEGITDHMRECEAKLLLIMSGNDPTYFPPSDTEDEIEAEGRHTPERPYQHPRGRLLSPELVGRERLPPPFSRISAREAISSLAPHERWRPPPTAPALQEKRRSPLQDARLSPPQNKSPPLKESPRRQKNPRRQPEAHKKRQNTGGQRQPRRAKPAPRVVEQILQSRRSSRRGGASPLWCLGDDGAPCLVTSRR